MENTNNHPMNQNPNSPLHSEKAEKHQDGDEPVSAVEDPSSTSRAFALQEEESIRASVGVNNDDYDYNSDYYSSEISDYSDEEDASSVNPMDYPDDESYATALQISMDGNLARHMMALSVAEDGMDRRNWRDRRHSQGMQQDYIDIDNYSYEEMLALGEAIGSVSKGFSADMIKSLPTVTYKAATTTNLDMCTICQMELEDRDLLNVLPCKHKFHSACICKWLKVSKECPECKAEVN